VVGVVCALLCGTAPAWQMTHSRWFQALQESGRSETSSRARQRLRSALVIGEIGMAMLLLVGAGLLLRSMEQLQRVETGFDPSGTMSAALSLPDSVYKTDDQRAAFFTALEQQLKQIPGVTNAAIADALPFTAGAGSASFSIRGRPEQPNDPGPHGNIRTITPEYFTGLRIPLVRGRAFSAQDRATTEAVVVIDETLAQRYWPNQDPIGQQMGFNSNGPWFTIVGLVKHAKSSSLESDNPEGFYFMPMAQRPSAAVSLVVRTNNSRPQDLANAIRSAVHAINPSQPVYDFKTMEERVEESLVSRRFLVVLLSIFAGLALLLAALGLYGVISYSVKLRTRELGIRMALGARRSDLLSMIVRKGMQLAVAGLALGLFTILLMGRALSSLLYQVSLFNLPTLLLTSLVLGMTVLLACYLPARRAAGLDPMRTLRED
jgi:predicted permease